ncbi:MAG TPA: hypothetical protein VD931_10655 [Baekduia sp.]|nr:hypothetical protein [Baekduia sp.]
MRTIARDNGLGTGTPPPEPPLELDPVDEGPMRRELLRQIALLDGELSARQAGWSATPASPRRGPAVLASTELERIRDELLAALDALR